MRSFGLVALDSTLPNGVKIKKVSFVALKQWYAAHGELNLTKHDFWLLKMVFLSLKKIVRLVKTFIQQSLKYTSVNLK